MNAINTGAPPFETPETPGFRWIYIILPAAVLLITIVFAAAFYGRLPAEAAYRFSAGVPVRWLGRGAVMAWVLGLQAVFFLLALGITLLVTGASRRMQLTETPLNRTIFSITGNVVALPQIIFAYATLGIFLYNIYGKSLPPLWAFALLVMLAGGVVLAVLFTRAFLQARQLKAEKTSGSESDARKQ